MSQNLFSVTIFFVVFRETLEAAIIVSVLLGLVEQIIHDDPDRLTATLVEQTRTMASARNNSETTIEAGALHENPRLPQEVQVPPKRRLIRKLRLQVRIYASSVTLRVQIPYTRYFLGHSSASLRPSAWALHS